MAIVIGDDNPNTLDLTSDPARSFGLENDRIAGRGDADLILSGAGDDFIDGGDGDDDLNDGDGNDTVVAGAGSDFVRPDAGNDVYFGGAGIDTLVFQTIHHGVDDLSEPFSGGV